MSKLTTRAMRLSFKESAEAWLEVQETEVSWGECVAGTLAFRGLGEAHSVTKPVVATLSSICDDHTTILASTTIVSGGLSVLSGQTLRFPFNILMPWGIPSESHITLSVVVRSGMLNQDLKVRIEAAPPVACVQAAKVLAAMVRMRLSGWEYTSQGVVSMELAPVGGTHSLRLVRLCLQRAEDDWYGELWLYPAAITRSGPLIVGVPFLETKESLLQEQFRAILGSAGFQAGAERNLPLPAEPPVDPTGDLPRPAERPDPAPDNLPVPSRPLQEQSNLSE